MEHSGNQRSQTKIIQRHVFVTGRVQGVGFRAFVLQAARSFGDLLGYVRNLPDGRVEAVFAGQEKEVLALCSLCKEGPSASRVDEIEVLEEEVDRRLGKFDIA